MLGERPQEGRDLAGNGHGDDRVALALGHQAAEPRAKAGLRLPGDIGNGFGLILLTLTDSGRHPGW